MRELSSLFQRQFAGPSCPKVLDVVGVLHMCGDKVFNENDEYLGFIRDITLDIVDGRIAYAVLSVGMGKKLFAIPWIALGFDGVKQRFVLEGISSEQLEEEAGFDTDDWPSIADFRWACGVHSQFGEQPFWAPSP